MDNAPVIKHLTVIILLPILWALPVSSRLYLAISTELTVRY